MLLPQATIERAFEALLARVRREPALWSEFQASRSEFVASPPADAARQSLAMAERRHAEWFLLERPSDGLQSAPAAALELDGEGGDEQDGGREALLGSFASVFEITGVRSGEGVWVRDLAGHGEYPLEEADASRALEPGDLLVGRIFPVGDALYRISHASGFIRDPQLLSAVRLDLERARTGRRGALRLSQRDLEVMFFTQRAEAAAPASTVTPAARRAAAIDAARRCLAEGGLEPSDVDDVLAGLASEPFDPTAVLPGAGDRLGQILDTLAFETDVDLEAARRALAAAWPELSNSTARPEVAKPRTRAPARQRADARRVERALSELDARRARGEDLEAVFADLEQALEIEQESDGEDASAPDFPGVVGAMVIEFLWDVERERGAEAARQLAAIANFAHFAQSQSVFENLAERDLLLYACLWLPEHAPSPEEAARWFCALEEFAAWAEERQDVALATALARSRAGLAADLPRICSANARLFARHGAPGEGGEMLGFEGDGRGRTSRGELRELALDPAAAALLRPGDFLRARRAASGAAVVVCAYPPQTDRLADL